MLDKNLGHYGTIQVFWDCFTDDHIYLLTADYARHFYQSYMNK